MKEKFILKEEHNRLPVCYLWTLKYIKSLEGKKYIIAKLVK